MSENSYQSGRLDLPFVGHCTFAKSPACVDWNAIDADVAVIGVPNDMGTPVAPGRALWPTCHPRGVYFVFVWPRRRL